MCTRFQWCTHYVRAHFLFCGYTFWQRFGIYMHIQITSEKMNKTVYPCLRWCQPEPSWDCLRTLFSACVSLPSDGTLPTRIRCPASLSALLTNSPSVPNLLGLHVRKGNDLTRGNACVHALVRNQYVCGCLRWATRDFGAFANSHILPFLMRLAILTNFPYTSDPCVFDWEMPRLVVSTFANFTLNICHLEEIPILFWMVWTRTFAKFTLTSSHLPLLLRTVDAYCTQEFANLV